MVAPAESLRAGTRTAPADVRRLLLNAASLLGAYAVPRAFTFAAVVVAARVLGAGEFGAYGTAAAYAVVLSIIATLGMMPLLVRELARSPELAPALLRAAHATKLASNVVMLGAVVVVARSVLGYSDPVVLAALLLGAGYAVGAFAENLGAYFQAVERMHVWLQANAAFGLVSAGLGIVLVLTTESLVWFCASPVIGQLAALAWLAYRLPPELRRTGAVDPTDVARLMRSLVPFAVAFVGLTVFYKVDVLLLARWRPPAEVGAYVAAYKFVDVVHALVIAGTVAIYPRLVREAPAAGQRERWAATRVAELLLLAVVPGAVLLLLLRAEAVHGLYGAGYGGAVPVLALLAPALPALALNLLAGYVLGASQRMRLVAVGYAAATTVKLGLNVALIPAYGAVGAAGSMLVSELLLAVAFLLTLRLTVAAAPAARTLAVAAAASGGGAVLALVMSLLPVLPGGLWAAALYGVFAFVLYWAAGVLPTREWRLLRQALMIERQEAR